MKAAIHRDKRVVLLLLAACAAVVVGMWATNTGNTQAATAPSDNPYNANLTYWFWGELDAPGSTHWLQTVANEWTALHPKVHIKIVPQSNTTVIPNFTLAASTKQGPDLATQWATLPVLTAAWEGASVPLNTLIP